MRLDTKSQELLAKLQSLTGEIKLNTDYMYMLMSKQLGMYHRKYFLILEQQGWIKIEKLGRERKSFHYKIHLLDPQADIMTP